MSIESVSLLPGLEATATDDFRVVYTAHYRVITTSATDGPLTVMNASALPTLWSSFSVGDSDVNAFVKKISVKQSTDVRTMWDVTVNWEPLRPGQTPDDEYQDRFNRPIRYWIESVNYTDIVEVDQAGDPIVNSANQAFDEPLTEERSRIVLCAEKPFATLQEIIDLNLSHAMSVNTDTFYGATARQCLCRPILCSQLMTENDISFYLGTFRIEFNEDTWDRKVVDRGFLTIDGDCESTADHANAIDKDGNFTAEPVLLDSDGTALGPCETGTPLVFETIRQTAFSELGI